MRGLGSYVQTMSSTGPTILSPSAPVCSNPAATSPELQSQLNEATQQLQALHLSHMLAPPTNAAIPGSSHGRSLYQEPGG